MKIGEIAKEAGVNVQTLHYYERMGILKPKSRLESGYRIYDDAAVRAVRFIKHAQQLGFSLDEIQSLLNLRVDKKSHCEQVQLNAIEHLKEVQTKISKLKQIEGTLRLLISDCKRRKTATTCPLLDCLDSAEFSLLNGGPNEN